MPPTRPLGAVLSRMTISYFIQTVYSGTSLCTCKLEICCFVLVICTDMCSTALEPPFRDCTWTTACCCISCCNTLICWSSWFSKISVWGASGWFRIYNREFTDFPFYFLCCDTNMVWWAEFTAISKNLDTYSFILHRKCVYKCPLKHWQTSSM